MNNPAPIGTPLAMMAAIEQRLDRMELKSGGGGGISSDVEQRVTRLETHMEYVRRDLDQLREGQEKMIGILTELPTKRDLWAWKWQWTAIGLALMAIVIGGIIGGLAWIQPAPSAPSPIVVSIPKQ